MEALTRIEIEFARLRDKLYIERMADVEKERIAIETGPFLCFPLRRRSGEGAHAGSRSTGTHPELLHLTQLIELRKKRKLDLAKGWLEGLEGSYEKRRDCEEHTTWNWWAVSLFLPLSMEKGEDGTIGGADVWARRQNGRDELRRTMLEDAFSKRRKLDREKRNMDRPKDGSLGT